MGITEVASILENQRIISRMENAQIRARMETTRIIGRLIRERAGKGPGLIERSADTGEIRTPPPANLKSVELSQAIKALRGIGERLAASNRADSISEPTRVALRGLAETQDLDLIESKGGLIDRTL